MNKYFPIIMLAGALFCGCKKTSPTPGSAYVLDQKNVSLHYDQQHQFAVTANQNSAAVPAITWKVSDTTIGNIDVNGLFKAKKIGTDTITATGQNLKLNAIVTVAPYYELFKEPYFVLGADTSTVKANETRKFSAKDEDKVTGEDRIIFSYHGENANITTVTYTFVNNKLVGCILYLTGNNDLTFINKLMTFYAERYRLDVIASPTYEAFYGPKPAYIEVDANNLDNITVSY